MPKDAKISRAQVMAMANLPEPSAMLSRLVPMLSQENVRLEELVKEIEHDQALVARMLKLVNSSYYHLKCKIDTVRAAVGLLGLATVRQTVYSAVCYNIFPEDERLSWSHAYTSSLLISKLAKGSSEQQEGCLQLTAILHDLGKIVMRRHSPKHYKAALFKAANEGIPPYEIEREVFGSDHGEVASWLLESWQMRPDIVQPIAMHHSESLPERFARETALLKIADWIDNQARDILRKEPAEHVFKEAKISKASIEGVVAAHKCAIASIEAEL